MSRIHSLAFALTVLLSACTPVRGPDVVGSGKMSSETRTVSSFTAVEASGAFTLEVTSGTATASVVVEGDDNIVPLFVTEVSGDELSLRMPSGSYSTKTALVVRVSAPDVARVDMSGAIEAVAAGLRGERFDSMMSGSCDLRAQGQVGESHLSVSGASKIRAFDLTADRVELALAGSTKAEVHAAQRLIVKASGASTVRYRGQPEVESSISGSGSVRPE